METDCISHIFIGWIFCRQQGDTETDRKALVKNVFAAADLCAVQRYLSSARQHPNAALVPFKPLK
jgi:hypothetical protein